MTTPTTSNFHVLQSPTELQTLLSADLNRLGVLYFRAEWAEVCKGCDVKIRELAAKYSIPLFLEIEAESLHDISESFDVDSVPYFIIIRGHTLLSRIAGAQLLDLEAQITKHATAGSHAGAGGKKAWEAMSRTDEKPEAPPSTIPELNRKGNGDEAMEDIESEEVYKRCRTLMDQSKVVLFMKGNPETPRCGFSQKSVQILKGQGVEFTSFDILGDEGVRQGLKKLNSWPTFPQLIINGKLVGGLDILNEMVQTGELKEVLAE